LGARARRLSSVVPFKVFGHSRLHTAVAGDMPPLMVLPCLSKRPRRTSSRVLVRGSLPAVPPASRYSMHATVRDRGPGCSLRLGRPYRV